MRKYFLDKIILIAVVLLVFQGCASFVPSTFWSKTDWTGPVITGDKKANIIELCESRPRGISDVIHCDRAFVDQNNDSVDVTTGVRDVIDKYLATLDPIKRWVKMPYYTATGRKRYRADDRSIAPYKFHILTISPVVVLVVPDQSGESEYCSRRIFELGCLPSRRMNVRFYWYKESPKIVTGSFWFSPTLKKGPINIPENSRSYTIKLPDSELQLEQSKDGWLVRRIAIEN